MILTCMDCHKLIEKNDKIRMTVEGQYDQIPSINKFRMNIKTMRFLADTVKHIDCDDPTGVDFE